MSRPLRLGFAALALGGCILFTNNAVSVGYNLKPQQYLQDFGTQMGTVPEVPCATDAVCAGVPTPKGTTARCDMTIGKCELYAEVRLLQTVNLSQEPGFPSDVANSSAVKGVTIGAVHYWTPTNTLTFDTPTIDIFVGPQSAQKENESGVARLGTVPSLPRGQRTGCRNGAPGTQESYCDMPLSPDGTAALAVLAKEYKTPFNVIILSTRVIKAGDPLPAGKLDLFIQPKIAFEVVPFR